MEQFYFQFLGTFSSHGTTGTHDDPYTSELEIKNIIFEKIDHIFEHISPLRKWNRQIINLEHFQMS